MCLLSKKKKINNLGRRKNMDYGYRDEKEGAFRSIMREWPVLLIEVIIAIVLAILLMDLKRRRSMESLCLRFWMMEM